MPLYKKSSLKAKVKTQNSFISPLLTQNNFKDLIKDDYKTTIPIPTKKKLLEPLINEPNDGDLLEKLQQRSLNVLKSLVEVTSTTQETEESDKNRCSDVQIDAHSEICFKKLSKTTNLDDRSKEPCKTPLSFNTQSPLLFNSTPISVKERDKKLKTEKSLVITTKIDLSSNTDGDLLKMNQNCDTPSSQLSDMLNDCVMNNLKMTSQMWNEDDFKDKNNVTSLRDTENMRDFQEKQSMKTSIKTKKIMQTSKKESVEELDSSLKSVLDEIVNTNIILSQEIAKKKISKTEKENSETENKKVLSKETKSKTNKSDIKKNRKKEKVKLKKQNLTKTNEELEKVTVKSKNNSNSPEMKKRKSQENGKLPSFKRIKAMSSDHSDFEFKLESNENLIKEKKKEKKAASFGNNLKQKAKNEYLIEKETSPKSNKKKVKDVTKLAKKHNFNEKTKNKLKGIKNNDKKKLEKKKSSTIARSYSYHSEILSHKKSSEKEHKNKVNLPPKPKNMIFTSDNPKTNKVQFDKLLELQDERDVGLYVYCDTCDKVRYLPNCKDPLELPPKWHCYMNPDPNYNKCTDPNYEIESETEDLLIHNKFHAGSIVWAKMDGYPWWPAMVDDDPDVTDYFWLDDENSTEPSWYHVTFFDSSEVTRAWIKTAFLEPFKVNEKNKFFKPKKYDYYQNRVTFAMKEAKNACKMDVLERLRQYSFVTRYFNKQIKKEKRNKSVKNDKTNRNTKKSSKYLGNKSEEIDDDYKENNLTEDAKNDWGDNLSVASSELSEILKPKKSGKFNKLNSEDILQDIDLNHFICNEEFDLTL